MLYILLLLLSISLSLSKDLYTTLGVNRRSTQAEIKKAFKDMSLKHHPDRNDDPNSAEKYQKIVNAYQILKDPVKKRQYDLTGSTDANPHSNFGHHHYQSHNNFGAFEQMFRHFQQQANSQRQRRQQQREYNNQQYEYVQYIDQFGRIRTVMIQKERRGGGNGGFDIPQNVLQAIMIPIQMLIIFAIAYILVSLCSQDDPNKGQQNQNQHQRNNLPNNQNNQNQPNNIPYNQNLKKNQ